MSGRASRSLPTPSIARLPSADPGKRRVGRPRLLLACLVLCVTLASPQVLAQDEGETLTERSVDIIWLEGTQVWMDNFRIKLSPKQPGEGDTATISVRIRRTRNGKGQSEVQPLKATARVGRDKGPSEEYVLNNPGASFEFRHRFNKPGRYLVSVVTYYSESETHTIGLRFEVLPAATTD